MIKYLQLEKNKYTILNLILGLKLKSIYALKTCKFEFFVDGNFKSNNFIKKNYKAWKRKVLNRPYFDSNLFKVLFLSNIEILTLFSNVLIFYSFKLSKS